MAMDASRGGGFDWPAVRSHDGHILHRVTVAPGERTCLRCGDTVAAAQDYCVRCSDTDAGLYVRDLVPTVEYLREDEFVLMR